MLSVHNRLSLRNNRHRIEAAGKTLRNSLFTIPYTFSSQNSSRFAFIIAKKSFPTSVERHKTKRILSQILRNNLSSFRSDLQAIVIPSYKIKSQSISQIEESLVSLLKTA